MVCNGHVFLLPFRLLALLRASMRAAKLMQFIVEILFKAATSSNNSHDQDYNVVRSILFCAL